MADLLEEKPEEALASGDDLGIARHAQLHLAAHLTLTELRAVQLDLDDIDGRAPAVRRLRDALSQRKPALN